MVTATREPFVKLLALILRPCSGAPRSNPRPRGVPRSVRGLTSLLTTAAASLKSRPRIRSKWRGHGGNLRELVRGKEPRPGERSQASYTAPGGQGRRRRRARRHRGTFRRGTKCGFTALGRWWRERVLVSTPSSPEGETGWVSQQGLDPPTVYLTQRTSTFALPTSNCSTCCRIV